ncbi:MAG: YciI family protein [Pseudomonadota bacterium]
MSNWQDYAANARSKGVLAKQFFMVRSTPVVPLEQLAEHLLPHLAYQKSLEDEGTLAFAGPLSDESGENWSGGGLIIYRAGSIDEARQIADGDPMHANGLRTYELRAWLLNEGSLNVSLSLSTQSLTFD